MYKLTISLVLLVSFVNQSFANEKLKEERLLFERDSIENVINSKNLSDREEVDALFKIARIYYHLKKTHKTEEYIGKALAKAKELDDKFKVSAYHRASSYYYSLNNFDKAIATIDLGLASAEKIRDSNSLGRFYLTRGLYYQFSQGTDSDPVEFEKALLKSLRFLRKPSERRAHTLLRLASFYYQSNDTISAGKYHKQLLLLEDSIDVVEMQTLKVVELSTKKKYAEVDEVLFKQLKEYEAVNWKARIAYQYYLLSKNAIQLNNYDGAIVRATKGYEYAKEQGLTKERSDLLSIMVEIYERLEDYKKALFYTRENDSILTSFRNVSAQLQQKELEKTEAEVATQQATLENEQQSLLLKNKQQQMYFLFGGIGVFLVISILAFRAYRQKRKDNDLINIQKDHIEEVHKEITDSINYAERIQRSFLATDDILNKNLNEYFVFFHPKDVVSGDFYWADELSNGQFALVNADSTGHGVPGAIMSILNISAIQEAVKEGATAPQDIFNRARRFIIDRLSKDGSKDGGKDGMDASIICFDFEKNIFHYTAAQNPIWIVRGGELIDIKPEKMPMGKHDHDHIPFIGGSFEMQKGDVIYTLTDGFQDQFGGIKGKKFKIKPFKNILIENAHLPLSKQKQILKEAFENWRGDQEQVDDVCVIGVRV
jgi:serine phosphatase RsbU (regulator of sigma subunit)